ncbi:MAG TPA: PEP-CTERM sorting domain-containing protein [Pyrinomonadaceae bacterium]|nr:PEP-CTERM sorting domain-containing protein [Pyrinomonadaceae bacterium]
MRPSSPSLSSTFTSPFKTLTFVFFLPLLLLCCVATAKADTVVITGGSLSTPIGLGNFSTNLTAPNFSFSGADMSAPKMQLCGPCSPGTNFGGGTHTVRVDLTFGFTYNGVVYAQNTNGMGHVVVGGGRVTFGPLTVPIDLSPVSIPFSYVGSVSAFPMNSQMGTATGFTLQLMGSGIVTFTFEQSGFNVRSRGVFAFAPPAPEPVPEPATMLLLGTGLAGLAVKARRRRRRE